MSDLRYALRALRSRPGFTLAAILTLGLCLGANTAMFTIVNAVVLRPLPYPSPDRIVSLSLASRGIDEEVVDDADYFAWLANAKSVSLAAHTRSSGAVMLNGTAEEIAGMEVTAPYFAVFGVRPLLGRAFTADEDRPGALPVVVIAERLWRRAFASDSAIVSRTITIDGVPTTVVGVLPQWFTTLGHAEYWRPYHLPPTRDSVTYFYDVVGRLRDGASLDALRSELATITSRLEVGRRRMDRGRVPVVMTLHERRYGDRRTPLLLLFGAVGVLLLVACANVANLALARAVGRQREFAVRLALGAAPWRLVRATLYESLLVSVAGGALGLALSWAAVVYFVRLSPAAVGNVERIRADWGVLGFTFVVAAATGVIFGLIPAAVASRQDPQRALSATPRSTGTVRQQIVRRVLVVGQLATAFVLLSAAGVVARTFAHVASVNPGFRPEGLVGARVRLPAPQYTDTSAGPFFDQLVARVRRVPGVTAATLVDALPLAGVRSSSMLTDTLGRDSLRYDVVGVAPDYFRTLGAAMIQGRPIDETDGMNSARVAVVNIALARLLFPGTSAIGRTISRDGAMTVVGVVGNVLHWDLDKAAGPTVYVPIAQDGASRYLHLMVRTSRPLPAVESAMTQIVRSIDPALPPPVFTKMEAAVAESVAPRKFTFVLLGIFATIAATLAVLGLYGVLSNVVADRTREIGIRTVLGADRARVVRLIVRQGAVLVVAGLAAGLAGSVALTRVVASLLYGVSARDPLTLATVPLLLGAVAMLATLVPAWRAARVDPVVALRTD